MKRQSALISAVVFLFLVSDVALGGIIVAWGNSSMGRADVPDGNDFVAISAGNSHALAIRSDGTLTGWGGNSYGQCDVPDGNNFVAVAAGQGHSLALKSDSSLEAWGLNNYGQCDVPNDANYITIGAGRFHSLGIRSDGSLAFWGLRADEPNMPPLPTGNFVKVDGGRWHSLAIRDNGSVIAHGPTSDDYNSCVPEGNYVDIAVYDTTNFALRENGSIVSWRCDGLLGVPDGNGFQDVAPYVAIDANGALAAWRNCLIEIPEVPPTPNDPNGKPAIRILPDGNGFVAVDAGGCFGIALTSNEFFTLTVSVEPNYIDSIVPPVGEYEHYRGEWVYINAPRDPNCPVTYKFDHWEGDVGDPNAQSQHLTINTDRTITAFYVPDERLCGDECHPILWGDLNEDCYINFDDFAIYASLWLSCTHPDCD